MPYLQTRSDSSLLFFLHVQPGAGRNALAGLHGDALKLRLAAPPVDGRANKAVIAFLSDLLRIPKKAVTIKSGLRSRQKRILLTGINEEKVRSLLREQTA